MAVDVLEREVDPVGCLVHGDRVRVIGERPGGLQNQGTGLFVEDRDHSAFGRDVEAVQALIECRHVRARAGVEAGGDLFAMKVDQEELGIVFPGDERKLFRAVDVKA
ncbi:hypothetical protein BMF89_00345 [Arthrobacter sp. SRS-W-1-2016]|nr:hypothetical protein BMF89_00345 [Arthrobacter sp. SRS-W-1-2016]